MTNVPIFIMLWNTIKWILIEFLFVVVVVFVTMTSVHFLHLL